MIPQPFFVCVFMRVHAAPFHPNSSLVKKGLRVSAYSTAAPFTGEVDTSLAVLTFFILRFCIPLPVKHKHTTDNII